MSSIKVTFVQPDGKEQAFEVSDLRQTLKDVARMECVPGIAADCGGACACATCHVHVDPAWIEVVGRASGVEADMLELASELSDTSRLSCQIELRPELNGLRVSVLSEANR
jgi:2Fe-2S ferredoxin